MDAVLYLLEKGVDANNIYWISPNDAWLFNRAALQVGYVAQRVLEHGEQLKKAKTVDDVFLAIEKTGGIFRIDENVVPQKWRCGTISPEELEQLRQVKNIIRKGRVNRISTTAIELQKGTIPYMGRSLFVDCSANGLSRRPDVPIFSEGKITLQSILFCQQVFSAAIIAKLALTNISDQKRNLIMPVPHPDYKEDWPSAISVSIGNLQIVHCHFPMWMFRSRLNFMSHEPFLQYLWYSTKALFLRPGINKAAKRIDGRQIK